MRTGVVQIAAVHMLALVASLLRKKSPFSQVGICVMLRVGPPTLPVSSVLRDGPVFLFSPPAFFSVSSAVVTRAERKNGQN